MPDHAVKAPLKLKTAVLIAGPTASGKSALAMKLAKRVDGEIVNADSMQVYRELRVLTARPSEADEARVPHHLYGFMSAAEACSAGIWAAHMASADLPLAVGPAIRTAVFSFKGALTA